LPRHPTQIYESVFHASAAVAIVALRQHGCFRGHLIKLYIIAYAVYRLLSEFVRPEPEAWLHLTAYQWFSLSIIFGFSIVWYRDHQQGAAEPLPSDVVSQQV